MFSSQKRRLRLRTQKPSSITFNVGAPTFFRIVTGNPRNTVAHHGPATGIRAGSHPLSPGTSSCRHTPLGSQAQPSCIAAPVRPLSPVQSNDCTPAHAGVRHHATLRVPSPQSPPGIHDPPKFHARRLPTNSPPGKPPRSVASPVALRPAHPPGSNFSCRHRKHSKAIAPAHQDLPDAPAVRSAAPQTPPGNHGPPRFRADRNPTTHLRRKVLRCAAGSGPHPRACPPHNNAAHRLPTSSAQSTRPLDSRPDVQTPLGNTHGIRDPPRSRLRHIPTNIPAGNSPRWSVFPARLPPAYSPDSIAAVRHPKSRELVSRHSDCLAPSPPWQRGIPMRTTQPSSSEFA